LDRFEAISAFAAVAEDGGFSAASRRLGMPLPTISRKVSELEAHLGAQLLVRSTRKVTLTETGQQFLLTCRRVLGELSEAEKLASGEYHAPRGELVVSAPTGLGSAYLSPIITEFLIAYPDIDIDLRLSDRITNLVDEQVDVAVRVAHLPDSSLIALKLGVIRHVVCASPAYLDERGVPETIADLSRHACVTFTALEAPREWIFRERGQTTRIAIKSRLSVSSASAAVEAATAGLGVSRLLCYQAAPALAEQRLRLVLRRFEPEPLPVSLVYPSGRLVPLKLRAFTDFVMPRLKQKLIFDP
jgi:DNA-binding transcriptional LysR family regulator